MSAVLKLTLSNCVNFASFAVGVLDLNLLVFENRN